MAIPSGSLGQPASRHVHPDGAPGDGRTEPGPAIVFHATAPSDGTYRLYLDFKHDGVVRTAKFHLSTGAHNTVARDQEQGGDEARHTGEHSH